MSRRLSREALEGRGPVIEAGKREGPEPSTNPSSVPYQEVLGGG